MQSTRASLDRFIATILFVKAPAQQDTLPESSTADTTAEKRRTENVFGLSLFFSGARCVLQYAILPFLLPAIGIAGEFATPVMLVVTVVAAVSIVITLRRFWRVDYHRKWQYLVVAVFALVVLVAYIIHDLQLLF
jgi:hypothetical protein